MTELCCALRLCHIKVWYGRFFILTCKGGESNVLIALLWIYKVIGNVSQHAIMACCALALMACLKEE